MAESSSEPPTAPAIPTDKPWLLNPKYPSSAAFFYAFLHEDHRHVVDCSGDEPSLQTNCEYYGGRQALLNSVERFRNFPGSMDFFESELSTPFPMISPRIYRSMTNSKTSYIFKREILVRMQALTMNDSFRMNQDNVLIMKIVGIYLRTKDEMMEGKLEFVPYEANELAKFGEQVTDRFKLATHKSRKFKIHLKGHKKIEYVFEKIKAMMPVNKYDPEFTCLHKLLQFYNKKRPVHKNQQFYDKLINMMHIITDEFNSFIEKNKPWFTPYPVDKRPTTAYVRLFKDAKISYVLGFELMEEMKRCGMDTVQVEEMLKDKGHLYCLDVRVVLDLKLPNLENGYRLVLQSEMEKIKEGILEHFKNNEILPPAKKKEVRHIDKGLWTINQLVEGIKYLKLDTAFPEMLKLAGNVFKGRLKEHFPSLDLCSAVEILQFFCITRVETSSQKFYELEDSWFEETSPEVPGAKPVEAKAVPKDSKAAPATSEVPPKESEAVSKDSEATSAGSDTALKDSEFGQAPASSVDSEAGKSDSEGAPATSEVAPKESEAALANSEKKLKDSGAASMDSEVPSADSGAAPPNVEALPKDSGSGPAQTASSDSLAAPADDKE